MKYLGVLLTLLGIGSVWRALPPLGVGVHATADLRAPLEPLIDAALDAAKTREETSQRYAEVAAFRRGVDDYAMSCADEAWTAGWTLLGIGAVQFLLGIVVLARRRPNQSPEPTPASSPDESPRE
jgi:hypothetical protein